MSNVTYSAGNLTITVAGLDTVEQALGDLKRKTPAAAKVAINATARQARKLMVAKAKTRYAVNAAGRRHLKDLVQRKKASNSSLMAELHIFKSITFDNGTEFAAAEELERSCVNKNLPRTKVYFCHPYSSWERGTNENTNGMIRRRFPKGTNFAAVTNAQIVQAENWINNYPRKILGYKSSEIVFRECLRELGIAA